MVGGGLMAVVAHPDDETMGCGATLALHASQGVAVRVVCVSCIEEGRRAEFLEALGRLGVEGVAWMEGEVRDDAGLIKRLADEFNRFRPKAVVTHLPFDYHREHRALYRAVVEAVEWARHTTLYPDPPRVERLLCMEVNTLIPRPSVLVDVGEEAFQAKMRALEAYASQLAKFPWGYYQGFTLKKGELRGAQCGARYAEAFLEEPIPRDGPFYPSRSSGLLV